uniref:Polysaccharide biosynthesis protein C-terminal domain-containing protein n=1 Tax=Eiseniibacteriota bacterium TaxID=2212470 RepID=A0A832I280_UNCEI
MSRAEIAHSVTRGTFYLALEKAAAVGSGLLYFALLLRWLGPTKYGIITLALSFAGLATTATGNFEMFLERFAADYHARGLLRTLRRAHLLALGVKLALGAVAGAVVFALAQPLAAGFDSPDLAVLLPVLAVFVAADGLSTTGRATLYGLQQFKWVSGIALAFHGAKTVMVGGLWFTGQGLPQLAAGLTALTVAQGLAATAVPLWYLRRARDEAPAAGAGAVPVGHGLLRQMIGYCVPLLGARLTFMSGQNLSRIVLGKMFTPHELGLFSFAYQTIERFVELAHTLPAAMLPALTRLVARGEHERLTRVFDQSHRIVQVVACTLSFGLFVFARELTLFVGSPLFASAIPLLQIMALVPIARTAQQPLTMLFQALKRPATVLHLALLKFGVEFACYFALVPAVGVAGAVIANLTGAAVSYAAALGVLAVAFPAGTNERLRNLGRSLLLFAPLLVAALAADALLPTAPSLALRAALVPVAAAGVFALALVTRYDLDQLSAIPLESAWMRRLRDLLVAVVGRLARAVEPRSA